MVRGSARAPGRFKGSHRGPQGDTFAVQIVAQARAALETIPTEGLSPPVAKLRQRVATAIPNMERIIQEADELRRGAQAECEALIDSGNIEAACTVLERLNTAPPLDRFSKAYLGLILVTSWLTSAYSSMLEAQKTGGGTG